jgi:hypothetical protein
MANTTSLTPTLLEKGLNEVFYQKYGETTLGMIMSDEVFNFNNVSIGMSETDLALAAVSEFLVTEEQKNLNRDEILERGSTIYQHDIYSNGFDISYKMLLADETGQNMIEQAAQLGQAARQSQEKQRMGVLRNGGTTVGLDGVSLFNDSHPLADGTTQDNDIAFNTNLYTTLKDMMSTLRQQVQYNGDLSIAKDPKMLLCTEANFDSVIEVVEAENIPNASNNNEINFISKKFPGLKVGWNPYLGTRFGGDDKDLFMVTDKTNHKLKVMVREGINTWMNPWTENDNIVTKYNAKYVESSGFSDYLGTVRGQSAA